MDNKNLGEQLLCSFKLEKGWKKKDLYNKLMEQMNLVENPESNINADGTFKHKQSYDRYYLKIFGNYDESLLPKSLKCLSCPYNDEYRKYDDYNELRDEKIKVIVLASSYADFRKYIIKCAYYTDYDEEADKDSDNVYVYADKKTLGRSLLKMLGLYAHASV